MQLSNSFNRYVDKYYPLVVVRFGHLSSMQVSPTSSGFSIFMLPNKQTNKQTKHITYK